MQLSNLKTYDRIIEIIKNKPSCQEELKQELGLSLQSIAEHLDRAVSKGVIGFLGKTIHGKITLDLNRKWKPYVQQYYVHTSESGKLYSKLIKKYKRKNKPLIDEIIERFRVIEIITKTQYVYFNDSGIIRRMFRAKGQHLTSEEISNKTVLSRIDVNRFYRKRHKAIHLKFPKGNLTNKEHLMVNKGLDKFLDIMPPLMHWVAYKEIPLPNNPNYDIKKSIPKQVTLPMLDKLGLLMVRKNNPN
jgi:hypothetical protein